MELRDSAEGVENLRGTSKLKVQAVKALMERASSRRATGSMDMNAVSSRSHAICTLDVTVGPDTSEVEEEKGNPEEKRSSTESAGRSGAGPNDAAIRAKLTLVDQRSSEGEGQLALADERARDLPAMEMRNRELAEEASKLRADVSALTHERDALHQRLMRVEAHTSELTAANEAARGERRRRSSSASR